MSRDVCWPWAHRWSKRQVTVPLWRTRSRGEVWSCKVCGKVKAK